MADGEEIQPSLFIGKMFSVFTDVWELFTFYHRRRYSLIQISQKKSPGTTKTA